MTMAADSQQQHHYQQQQQQRVAHVAYRPRGERPFLLPFNRRIRHLHGISLRNLTLSTSPLRLRAKTIDDDALPYSLSSPSKLLALNDNRTLAHARSHSDLKARTDGVPEDEAQHYTNGHAVTPKTSRQQALRRQSALDWHANSPRFRRKRVQDAITRHVSDVFFSLHAAGMPEDEPLYVSEVVDRTMNPDFRYFDLQQLPLSVKRRSEFTVRVWARPETRQGDEWTFVLEQKLDLSSLHYLGRSLEDFDQSLPDNCVLALLTDGLYASFPDARNPSHDPFSQPPQPSTQPAAVDTTSSFDALMKLSNLDTCVQDALATHHQLTAEIRELIESEPASVDDPIRLAVEKDTNASAHRAVNQTKNQISKLQHQVTELRRGIRSRRGAMHDGRSGHSAQRVTLSDAESTLSQSRALHAKLAEDVAGQRRRTVADLSSIYPIEPAARTHSRMTSSSSGSGTPTSSRRGASPHPPLLSFTIRSLPLPNSTFAKPGHAATATATALGHVAHALALLSAYFSTPLPYPLTPRGSTSTVADPISALSVPAAQRTFPLFLPAKYATTAAAAGTAAFDRFEYAVFLLNKDVEILAARAAALRVLDPRHTLPNLKYFALVVTAGSGDVPLRKVGGVKGLLGRAVSGDGSGSASGASSRRGSSESEGGRAAELVRRRLRAS